MKDQEPDVAAIFAELREQVRCRHAYFSVDSSSHPYALNLAELKRSIEMVSNSWYTSAYFPITWRTRVVGRLGAYARRAMRVLLNWYINPILEQQNLFNCAVARTLVEMAAYQESLTRKWQALEDRVERLESPGDKT